SSGTTTLFTPPGTTADGCSNPSVRRPSPCWPAGAPPPKSRPTDRLRQLPTEEAQPVAPQIPHASPADGARLCRARRQPAWNTLPQARPQPARTSAVTAPPQMAQGQVASATASAPVAASVGCEGSGSGSTAPYQASHPSMTPKMPPMKPEPK